jgi:hypothetical protein
MFLRGLLCTVPLVLGCARPLVAPEVVGSNQAKHFEDATPRQDGGAAKAELPEACRGPALALDARGQSALLDLERHLVEDVLADDVKDHEDGWFNALEVRGLLRRYPATEVAFLFPASIPLPNTRFRTRTGGRVEELTHTSHSIFYLHVADVQMVRSGNEIGLVLDYGSGPAGSPPKGVMWLWGEWGRFCAFRGLEGTWQAYPLGPVMVSDREQFEVRSAPEQAVEADGRLRGPQLDGTIVRQTRT